MVMRRRCLGRSGRPGRPPGARLGPGCGRWRAAGRQEAPSRRPAAAGPARVRGRGLGGLSPSVEGAVEGLASWNVPPRRSRSARVPGRPGTKKVPATRPITASMSKPRVGVPDPPWSPHHRPHGEQGPVDRGRVRSRPRPAVPDRRGTDRATGPQPGHNRPQTSPLVLVAESRDPGVRVSPPPPAGPGHRPGPLPCPKGGHQGVGTRWPPRAAGRDGRQVVQLLREQVPVAVQVIDADLLPRWCCTASMLAPSRIGRLAHVWRRSWTRSAAGRPAARAAGLRSRPANLGSRSGPPAAS